MVAEERYRNLLDASPNAISVQSEGKFIYINMAGIKFMGANSPEEVIGKSVFDIIPLEYHETVKIRMKNVINKGQLEPIEFPIIRLDGKKIYVESIMTLIDFMGKQAYMSVGTDITERKDMEEKLHYIAYHDKLTGLPNRYMLNNYLEKSLARCKRNGHKEAILFFDLDRFKFVNDIKGHSAGDYMLKQVTDRLVGTVRKDDIVSRFGGDEFIIVLEDVEQSQIKEVANRILEMFTHPFLIQNEEFFISPSIGISMFPDDGENSETLIKLLT
jgi:diguanylate cyclase (GGDEF)-like protein/PAS domain S-box-containing protein